jgi:hypothetical protein
LLCHKAIDAQDAQGGTQYQHDRKVSQHKKNNSFHGLLKCKKIEKACAAKKSCANSRQIKLDR